MSDFDQDLVRIREIASSRVSADCGFLLGFIDKLWQEYTRTLGRADSSPPEVTDQRLENLILREAGTDIEPLLLELKARRAGQQPEPDHSHEGETPVLVAELCPTCGHDMLATQPPREAR